jgi:D-inositol-3-phosphate glycosyltransferase
MKIALVGPGWPLRGGIAQYSTKLAGELALHHELTYIGYARQYPALLFPGKTQLDESAQPLKHPAQALLDSIGPRTWWRAADAIQAAGARLAVIMWWHPFFAPCLGTLARLLARRGIPSVFLCHNVAPHEGSRLTRVLSRWAFAPASGFIVHATELVEPLAALTHGQPIAVSPHPLYDQFGDPPDQGEARRALGVTTSKVLLFFGLVRAYKGVATLIDAFARVAEADPDVTLVIAGECYEPEELYRRMIVERDLAARIKFENRFVPNEDVARYFAAADVLVLPYHAASQSGVIPVAYALGRPVIATRVGGLPEVVTSETGALVPPRDAAALAAAIQQFYEAGGAARFADGIARARTLFSWSRMRETLERLAAQSGIS